MAQGDARQDRGDDAVGRFVAAVETSEEFGKMIRSGDRAQIAAALKQYRIELPAESHEKFVTACIGLASVNGWGHMNDIRNSLMMPPGIGIMG